MSLIREKRGQQRRDVLRVREQKTRAQAMRQLVADLEKVERLLNSG